MLRTTHRRPWRGPSASRRPAHRELARAAPHLGRTPGVGAIPSVSEVYRIRSACTPERRGPVASQSDNRGCRSGRSDELCGRPELPGRDGVMCVYVYVGEHITRAGVGRRARSAVLCAGLSDASACGRRAEDGRLVDGVAQAHVERCGRVGTDARLCLQEPAQLHELHPQPCACAPRCRHRPSASWRPADYRRSRRGGRRYPRFLPGPPTQHNRTRRAARAGV